MMTHLISLGVGTSTPEQHSEAYRKFSQLADELRGDLDYVSLTSQSAGPEDGDEEENAGCTEEHLHHDEDTLAKVRDTLKNFLTETFDVNGDVDLVVTDAIRHLSNAGILFRERSN